VTIKTLFPLRRHMFPRVSLLRVVVLLVSDALALAAALAIAVAVKAHNSGGIDLAPYLRLWPFTFVFLASYWMSGLYSQPARSQPEDLQRGTACTCCIFLSLSAFTLTMRGGSTYHFGDLYYCQRGLDASTSGTV
jgi:hypothetical protein